MVNQETRGAAPGNGNDGGINSGDGDRKKQRTGDLTDARTFIASMTFASQARSSGASCDCDDCGSSKGLEIPFPIAFALETYRRQRPLQRTQDRQLMKRQKDISVWEWALPLQAEPMLEFGSSHRIILVERLPGILQTIGAVGVVGSRQEEGARNTLDWKQGDVLLLPSNEGRAIGFVHAKDASREVAAKLTMYATLIICKVPRDALDSDEKCTTATNDATLLPAWCDRLRGLCMEVLQGTSAGDGIYKLNDTQASVVRNCIGSEPPAAADDL